MKLNGPCCVDVTKGCALLIKSENFRKINMFNEKFFLFWDVNSLALYHHAYTDYILIY